MPNDKVVDNDLTAGNDLADDDLFLAEDEISFHSAGTFCVCFASIIGPMENISRIRGEGIKSNSSNTKYYYTVFLNSMASIARQFNAKIIKSVGDGLLWYFPCTSSTDYRNEAAFKRVFDCARMAIQARSTINSMLYQKLLLPPALNYRISADYGPLEIATSKSLGMTNDFFGPIMNTCSKINSLAPANGFVIGENLYKVVSKFPFLHGSSSKRNNDNDRNSNNNENHYKFVEVKMDDNDSSKTYYHYSPDPLKQKYSVFSVIFKDDNKAEIRNVVVGDPNKKTLAENTIAMTTISDKSIESNLKDIIASCFPRDAIPVRKEELEKLQRYNNIKGASVGTKHSSVAKETEPSSLLQKQQQYRTINIMIVDDEPDILLVLREFLEDKQQQKQQHMPSLLNFNVHTFSDSNKALNKFAMIENNHPSFYDLVILDVRMPQINGLQLYQRFKAINNKTKIVFLTALDTTAEIISIFPDLTRNNVLQKPISNSEFIRRIEHVINS